MNDQERIRRLEKLVVEQIPRVSNANAFIEKNEPMMSRTSYINWLAEARALGLTTEE